MAEEDLLFGKNRHMFGGIEPSNMVEFEAELKNSYVEIKATLPKDTILNGQTLCTVAGAVIRRKENVYPNNEFDGEFIADINGSTVINDTGIESGKTYCYMAFPYTTQGVYNRNIANRSSINMPAAVAKFSGKSAYDYSEPDDGKIELTIEIPSTVEGVILRRSTERYPENELEGDEVTMLTSSGVYKDTGLALGTRYYYSAFTYTGNVVNRDISKSINVNCAKYGYLYGFDLDTNNDDPATRVTYPIDVDNAGFKPVRMNYDLNKFDYGDWPSESGKDFMPRPCMLSYDGTVRHYLDPNDYTKREDGVTDSKVADLDFKGQAMMEWPKIYTYREEVDGIYKFRCSDTPQGPEWDCWCNYDEYDNVIDHFYMSIYDCGLTKGTTDIEYGVVGHATMRSMSGINVNTAQYNTEYRKAALPVSSLSSEGKLSASGLVYGMWDTTMLSDHLLVQDLLILIGRNTDCQSVFGTGVSNGTSGTYETNGAMNNKGLFYGSNNGTEGVKVFGMENYWGNASHFISGWRLYSYHYAKITRGTHDGSTLYSSTSYSHARCVYNSMDSRSYGVKISSHNVSGDKGYISSMHTTQYGRFPINPNGSATTYESDYYDIEDSSSDRAFMVGGKFSSGANAGPFYCATSSDTTGSTGTCARLSCKPNHPSVVPE